MKINAKKLESILADHYKVLDPKGGIFSNIHMKIDNNILEIQSSDRKRILTSVNTCEGTDEIFCVSSEKLLKMLKGIEGDVEIKPTSDAERFNLKAKGLNTKLSCTFPENYPYKDNSITTKAGQLESTSLIQALARISNSIDTVKHNFLNIEVRNKEATFAAIGSGGFQLSLIKLPTTANDFVFNIFVEDIPILFSIIEPNETIEIFKDDLNMAFRTKDKTLQFRQIVSTFPNYSTVLREDWREAYKKITVPNTISIDKHLLVNEDDRISPVELTFSKNKLITSSQDREANTVSQEFDVIYEGMEFSLKINGSYLRNFFSKIKSNIFYIYIDEEQLPNDIKFLILAEDGFEYIKMVGIQQK